MNWKFNLFVAVVSIFVLYASAAPTPVGRHEGFRHEEVVVPVPIVYSGEYDSFENILNGGRYRYETRGSQETKEQGEKPVAVSNTPSTDDDDEDDDADEEHEDEGETTSIKEIEDALNESDDELEESEDEDAFLIEGKPKKKVENDDDDDDDDEEDDDKDEDDEKKGERKERYLNGLFGHSGINDSYGWYGWPNQHNHNRHHGHGHYHGHNPTFHHGFYTGYY